MEDYIDEQKKAWEKTGSEKDELKASLVEQLVMCDVCKEKFPLRELHTITSGDSSAKMKVCLEYKLKIVSGYLGPNEWD